MRTLFFRWWKYSGFSQNTLIKTTNLGRFSYKRNFPLSPSMMVLLFKLSWKSHQRHFSVKFWRYLRTVDRCYLYYKLKTLWCTFGSFLGALNSLNIKTEAYGLNLWVLQERFKIHVEKSLWFQFDLYINFSEFTSKWIWFA